VPTFLYRVMAGLDPAIHAGTASVDGKAWMPGSRPGMKEGKMGNPIMGAPRMDCQGLCP
jgi:hypothetical protein